MALNIAQLAGPGGKGANPGNPATTPAFEPVTGDQDSLTQFVRSMQNVLGQQGTTLTAKGSNAVSPAINYFQKLVSGGEAANEATMPEQDQITDAFNRVRQMISTMPRGGGKASAEVQAPFTAIKDIAEVKSGARKGAAAELGSLGTTLAGLGLQADTAASSAALARRGQNLQEDAQNKQMITDIGTSIGKLLAGGGLGSLLGGGSKKGAAPFGTYSTQD